jgi:hypothetical protein
MKWKGNGIAGFQAAQLFRVTDLEGHGHGGHVIGDGLALDDDGFAVQLQLLDQAVDEESLWRRRRGEGLFVAGGQDEQGPEAATEGTAGALNLNPNRNLNLLIFHGRSSDS